MKNVREIVGEVNWRAVIMGVQDTPCYMELLLFNSCQHTPVELKQKV